MKAETCEDVTSEIEDEKSYDNEDVAKMESVDYRVTKKGKIRKQVPRTSGT